jgi:hypothetical protein
MKLKRLIMVFEQPLDKVILYQGQNVTQEDILMADVQGIRDKIKRELNRVLRSINMIRILKPVMFDVLSFHVKNLEHRLVWMVEFKKVTPTRFEFIFPTDANALITIKEFASKLGPFKNMVQSQMEGKDLQLVKILRERELITAFEKFSFREMKLEPGTWSISADEFESDPDAPPQSPSLPIEGQLPSPNTPQEAPRA